MRIILLIGILSTSGLCAADPAPFGLEIGKTSITDLKKKYSVSKAGINAYSGGMMYKVSTAHIKFEGLKELFVIFDKKGILAAVMTKLPDYKFNYLLKSLRSKYTITSSELPFVGSKEVKFKSGNTEITLRAPHFSFSVSMNYLRKDFLDTYRRVNQRQKRQKQKRESSQL